MFFSCFNVFFHVFMFYVGLLTARLCFISDILLFIDLFSCIAASPFNKPTYLRYCIGTLSFVIGKATTACAQVDSPGAAPGAESTVPGRRS